MLRLIFDTFLNIYNNIWSKPENGFPIMNSSDFEKCFKFKSVTILDEEKCVQSISRKGNCWDNAVAESFFKTIKIESLYRHKFENVEEVYSAIFDYIDGWYNTKRIHSSLGGKSPREMAEILTNKSVA